MRRRSRAALAVLLGAAGAAACTNPVSPTAHERPDGFVILHGADTVATGDRTTSSGTLHVAPGGTVQPLRIEFVRGGATHTPGADYFLRVEILAPALATFEPDEPGAFTGSLRGVASGSTAMRVRLMHGRVGSPRAHSDFDGSPVPLVVGAAP